MLQIHVLQMHVEMQFKSLQTVNVKTGGENLLPECHVWLRTRPSRIIHHQKKDTNACKSTFSDLDVVPQAF